MHLKYTILSSILLASHLSLLSAVEMRLQESTLPTQSESDRLYQQIYERGSLIQFSILKIKDEESALRALPSLRTHHEEILKSFEQLHAIISKDGYHMYEIQERMLKSTRLFGTIGILAHDILQHKAYGVVELEHLLAEYYPKVDELNINDENNKARLLLQSDGLSTPSSFIRAEHRLHQLHDLLQSINSPDSAEAATSSVNELVVFLLQIDVQIKAILAQADEQEEEVIINKLHLIRHLGSLCQIEIERLKEANFYDNQKLLEIFSMSREEIKKRKLEEATL